MNYILSEAAQDLPEYTIYNRLYHKRQSLKAKGKPVPPELDEQIKKAKEAYDKAKNATKNTGGPTKNTATKKNNVQNDPEYQEGHDAAIEAIRNFINNGPNTSGGGNQGDAGEGLPGLPGMSTPKKEQNQENNDKAGAGSMLDEKKGDEIAEKEGYGKGNRPSDADQKRQASEAANKLMGKKEVGNGAGGNLLIKRLNKLYKASVDWAKVLKNIVGRSLSPRDYAYEYTKASMLGAGFNHGETWVRRTDKDKFDNTDAIVVYIDTSGSVSEDMIHKVLCEIYDIACKKKPTALHIRYFDTQVWREDAAVFKDPKEFRKYLEKPKVKGGGGTDFGCIADDLQEVFVKARINVDVCIIFTDGYADHQPKRSKFRKNIKNFIWVIYDNIKWQCDDKSDAAHTRVIYTTTEDIMGGKK